MTPQFSQVILLELVEHEEGPCSLEGSGIWQNADGRVRLYALSNHKRTATTSMALSEADAARSGAAARSVSRS